MGRQINYYMGYKDFLSVAQAAIDCGCVIHRRSSVNGKWKLDTGISVDIVEEDCIWYFFHNPAIGSFHIDPDSNHISFNSRLNVIEAGFSFLNHEKHLITRNRLYTMTGIYNDDGEWISRSEEIDKIYNKLVRVVKRVAPYTEVEYSRDGETWTRKEYITSDCYNLIQNRGYRLGL